MTALTPARGEIWLPDFDPTVGHEQSGRRPALVLSMDEFNRGRADLIIVAPITSRRKGIVFHVEVEPPEGGLSDISYIKCEDVRSVSKLRLGKRLGSVTSGTMSAVEDRLRVLMGL